MTSPATALGLVRDPRPAACFLFPDPGDSFRLNSKDSQTKDNNVFVFQYWPESVSDSDETTYSEKLIPGGSHPLQQWVGGGNRTISFDAVFTEEVEFNQQDPNASSRTFGPVGISERYSVDVAAAIAKLRQHLYPEYTALSKNILAKPPNKLILVLPNTRIGHDSDAVPVILKSMNVNIESSFPSGRIRVATVSLSFTEIVQRGNGERASIRFVDRTRMFKEGGFATGNRYSFRAGDKFSTISAG